MQAIVVNELGGPEVMKVAEVPDPVAAPGQVVVRIAAAGVNFRDIYVRTGMYKQPLPYTPGSEGAGTVTEVGEGVTGIAVGDEVAWSEGNGGYAELAAVPAAKAVPLPAGLDPAKAAASMLQGITAHYLCRSTFPVTEGTVTVVHAAAGGVGLLLTQMIKRLGGTVIATTSTPEKAALAEQAGADAVTTYDEFPSVVREATGGRGADVVFDGVGQATFDAGLSVLRPRGMMVLFGASSGAVPPFDPQRLNSSGSLFLTRQTMGHYVLDRDELLWRAGEVFGPIAAGELNVRVGGEYPLADAARAHEDLAARRTTGKLVLLP